MGKSGKKGDTLTLPALSAKIKKACLINGKEVPYIQQKNSLKLIVPTADREEIATLITITTDKPLSQIGLISPFSTSRSLAYGCRASASRCSMKRMGNGLQLRVRLKWENGNRTLNPSPQKNSGWLFWIKRVFPG